MSELVSVSDLVCPSCSIAFVEVVVRLQKVVDEVGSCISEECFGNIADGAVA